MTERPFHVRRIGRGAENTLEIQISFVAGVLDRETQINPLFGLLDAFIRVAQSGGFSGDRIAPTASTLRLQAREILESGVIRLAFADALVDPRIVIIIENLMHHVHLTLAPIMAIQIATPLVTLIDEAEEDLPYLNEPLPFDCSTDYEGLQICVELSFLGEVTDEIAERYTSAWDSWGQLAESECFADDIYPVGQNKFFVIDEPIVLHETIIYNIDEFSTGDQSFDILLNMFQRLHVDVLPLESISIS